MNKKLNKEVSMASNVLRSGRFQPTRWYNDIYISYNKIYK